MRLPGSNPVQASTARQGLCVDRAGCPQHRGTQYDDPDVRAAIEEVRQKIEANPDAVSEEDILAEARKLPQNRFFFANIDGIVINPSNNDARQ
ncbi:hypothetical protein MPLB_1700035 [Mesorhizobium sp. ORS 3324]|nr:hypothetical protein MPLB_1700035 [Mesorhizobium sp. ORS 3324]